MRLRFTPGVIVTGMFLLAAAPVSASPVVAALVWGTKIQPPPIPASVIWGSLITVFQAFGA